MSNFNYHYYPDPNSYTDYNDNYACKYCGCVSSEDECPTCGAHITIRFFKGD